MEINDQSLESTATPAITHSIAQQAMQTNQDVAKSYDSGGMGRGLLNAPDNFNRNLSSGSQAQTDAIRSRYMPQFQRAEKQLSIDNMKNAQSDHVRNLAVATQAAGEEVSLNKQKAILKDKMERAQRAARGAVLGHVLGIVGGVVGGVVTGGVGAAGGFAAGEAAGNAIGGS